MSGRVRISLFVVLLAASARADATNRLALEMSGVRYGLVTLKATDAPQLVVSTQDIAPSLALLVGTFAQGKPVKRDIRLSNGAVLRKTNDARLASVKLPALGAGGTADVELAFVASALATQPVLSAKEAPPPPAAARITGFRIDISTMKAIEAPKLDAITLTQKADGNVTIGDIAFDTAAGGAPPFTSWQKSGGARPAPRAVHIEYIGADGAKLLELQLERCTPNAVVPMGANGTTRVTLSCANVHAS